MSELYIFLGCFICVSGLFTIIINYMYLLNMLLSLELISVGLYFVISISFFFMVSNGFFFFYFLIMSVCEAVLGLSLLVLVTYGYGEDNVNNLNLLSC